MALRVSHNLGAKISVSGAAGEDQRGGGVKPAELSLRVQTRQMNCEVQEVNVLADHVHLIFQIPPKLSISEFMGN